MYVYYNDECSTVSKDKWKQKIIAVPSSSVASMLFCFGGVCFTRIVTHYSAVRW
jgi:hypothetical protein